MIPIDANQADAVRYLISDTDNSSCIVGGHSKFIPLRDSEGNVSSFEYGKADILREGVHGYIDITILNLEISTGLVIPYVNHNVRTGLGSIIASRI